MVSFLNIIDYYEDSAQDNALHDIPLAIFDNYHIPHIRRWICLKS